MPPQRSDTSLFVAGALLCVSALIHLHSIRESRKARDDNPSDRSSSNSHRVGRSSSKNKKAAVWQDMVCPITLELPINPVTAEDGRVYERSAIEKYFTTKGEGPVKSPITGEVLIGRRLLQAPQHRNIIEALIENGALTGDLADKWLEKAKEKKTMEGLLKRAENGDIKAMETVGINYFRGENGFSENDKQAYLWFQKAHRAGSVLGTAHMGYMLASGVGITRNKKEGIVYLGIAAGRGSDMAAYRLGMAWADGKYGLPPNAIEATSWLKLSLSGDCTCCTMNEKSTKKAQLKLEEVTNRSRSDDDGTSAASRSRSDAASS